VTHVSRWADLLARGERAGLATVTRPGARVRPAAIGSTTRYPPDVRRATGERSAASALPRQMPYI
jgi:hypothetical protein